jgi:hypothetical protein
VKDVACIDARVSARDFMSAAPKRLAALDVRLLSGIELVEAHPFFRGQGREHCRDTLALRPSEDDHHAG